MEINVKFTAIEWWKLNLQEAKDEKLEYKIKHAEKQLDIAKFLNKYGVNREIEEESTFIYGFKINNCVKY